MLLFAGALHVNIGDLKRYKLPIGILACIGTIVSALLIDAGRRDRRLCTRQPLAFIRSTCDGNDGINGW